jgi:hypothetical protein
VEAEQFRVFGYDEVVARDKANLDIVWLKDDSLEDSENLPAPEVIAREIVEDLEAARSEFAAIMRRRSGPLLGASEREVVLSEHGSLAREGATAYSAQALVVAVFVQNLGGQGDELFNLGRQVFGHDRLHPAHPVLEAKKAVSRSQIMAADCSAGRWLQSTLNTSKPAWISRSVACR